MKSELREVELLMKKQARQERRPIEAFVAALFATVAFGAVYYALTFRMRYESYNTALLMGPGMFILLCTGLGLFSFRRYNKGLPSRGLILCTVAGLGGTAAGMIVGENAWWKYTVMYYNYQDMGSYVNVDPGVDVGQSFMDAGTIYFKESTYVLERKALAFRNGATYCVAPIVRAPVQIMPGQANPNVLETSTGFSPPKSGTIDFWAVGKDCCGSTGTDEPFTCGGAASAFSRTGMRILNNNDRAMYLLAVQEWSATTGLPVRHPMFFNWVKDPIDETKAFYKAAWAHLWLCLFTNFVVALIAAFLLQMLLVVCRVRAQ